MSEDITFGGWLKQHRRESGVTQEELAESIGCSGAAIRKIEVGERHPSGQIAQLLADYLLIPADEREAFIAFARSGRSAFVATQTAPGDTVTRAPWRNVYLHQTNLPAMLTPLIGRDQEAAAAHNFLANSKVRLLTLTGAPGIGKTRLALQVASNLVDRFEDGVFLVELAAVTNPDLVSLTTARTLGLKDVVDQSAQSILLDYVRNRKMLLVLDNFEQVLDAAASIVKLMEASPWLKALVTSREALHVRGERRIPLHALGLPVPALYSNQALNRAPSVAALASYPSVQLFVERAQDVSPDFELTQENASDVALLCVGLEGLPLAIELAAARANHLSAAEMRAALDNRLKLLTGGGRDLPARHRTLKSAVEWSYDLLDEAEQALFRRLGVFAGGCTLAAIQAISEVQDKDGIMSRHSSPTLDRVLALVDKSLVRQQGIGITTADAPGEEEALNHAEETRFSTLEAIKEYALERLVASGDAQVVRKHHALYFLSLARQAKPQLNKPNQKWWIDRLNLEMDNFRAALTWSLEANRSDALEIGLNMGAALWYLWLRQGYVTEGRGWLERFLIRLDIRLSADYAGTNDEQEIEEIVQAISSHPLGASALQVLNGAGALAVHVHDMDNAHRYLSMAMAIAQRTGNKVDEANLLNGLGNLSNHVGDYNSALRYYADSIEIKRATIGWDERNIAATLTSYSWTLASVGRLADALVVEEGNLMIQRRLGDMEGVGRSLYTLAGIAWKTDDYAAAGRYGEQILEIARNLGNQEGEAHALRVLGDVAWAQGRFSESQAYLTDSLARFQGMEQQNGALDCIARLAQVAASQGQVHRAAILAGAHVALHTAINTPQLAIDTNPDSTFALLRLQDEAAWTHAWAIGQAMTLSQVIAYLLNDE